MVACKPAHPMAVVVGVHSLPPTALPLSRLAQQDRRGDMLEHSVLGAGRTLLK